MSPACKNCYAETWARRLALDLWGKNAPRRLISDGYWRQPLIWDRAAQKANRRDRVFCASMADVFEDRQDLDASRARLWALIQQTPHLDWLLLTKRPQCVGRLIPWRDSWPRNIWLGTTIENQRWAEKRLPHLLAYPATVHFASCEPLLGPLRIEPWLQRNGDRRGIGWVIAGGESGPRARPMNPEWPRALRDQCATHGVPYHFKQWGNWRPASGNTNGHEVRMIPASSGQPIAMIRLNKKLSGRTLDGKRWDGLPTVT